MIVPVLEEVLVVETRLMLKEELRISKHAQQVHEPRDVTVRIEEARVERIPSEGNK
jgi:stress response protein YsnF